MEEALWAGAAAFTAGRYEAALEVWRDGSDDATDEADARLLDGLAAFADVVARGRAGRFEGLPERASEAMDTLARIDMRGDLDAAGVRDALAAINDDPTVLERREPPTVAVGSAPVRLDDLGLEATLALAGPLAAAVGYERTPVERAVRYARADLDAGDSGSAFVALVFDFVREADARPIAHRRLVERGDRRAAKERDVEGLFG